MKYKVYISGAIAHYDLEERRQAFDNAERFLSLKGYIPSKSVQERFTR